MKLKTFIVAVVVAAIVPVAALADTANSADKADGARACKALKTSMGATFVSTYATFGKCVSQWARAEHQNRHEARTGCKAERADAGFAAAHGGKTFAQFYGTGKQGANALGRCMKGKAAVSSSKEMKATVNASKQCKAERTLNAADFKTKYGTGEAKANAFGNCVSTLAQAQQ